MGYTALWLGVTSVTCLAALAADTLPEIPMAYETVRLVTVQVPLEPGDAAMDTADLVVPAIERAGREAADLVVLPEYVLGMFDLPGPLTAKVADAARRARVNVVVGGWEKLPGYVEQWPPLPRTYANTALVFDREGLLVGKYRKNHAACGDAPYCWPPKPDERGEWTMQLGESLPVFDLDFGRIGVLTCYDGYFFPVFETLSLKGAEILVWINGRPGVEDYIVKAASFLTCTAIVTANNSQGAGAMICDYPANILRQTTSPGESYLSAEISLLALRQQRRNNRMFHQRRPELYRELLEPHAVWEHYPYIPEHSYPPEDQEPRGQ